MKSSLLVVLLIFGIFFSIVSGKTLRSGAVKMGQAVVGKSGFWSGISSGIYNGVKAAYEEFKQ